MKDKAACKSISGKTSAISESIVRSWYTHATQPSETLTVIKGTIAYLKSLILTIMTIPSAITVPLKSSLCVSQGGDTHISMNQCNQLNQTLHSFWQTIADLKPALISWFLWIYFLACFDLPVSSNSHFATYWHPISSCLLCPAPKQ